MTDEPVLDQPILPLGLLEGTTTISSTAAPLLAGFALTILLLILPATSDPTPFLRWPEPTLFLLVISAALLINAVQAGAHARATHLTPDEARMWLEELGLPAPAITRFRNDMRTRTAASINWTRRLYQGGIVLLLAAITLVLVPAEGVAISGWRSASIAAGGLATLAELVWIGRNATRATR